MWLLGLLFLWQGIGEEPAARSEPAPVNVLFCIADDWGWPHAGVYGETAVRTPVFDRIARQGVLFEHAYAAAPSCTPSRNAIFTGRWHWRLRQGANLWSSLDAEIPTWTERLQQAGWFVGKTGKAWGPGKLADGGRKGDPAGPRYPNLDAFLEAKPKGQPFCFWLGTSDPHRPFRKGAGRAAGIDPAAIRLPDFYPDDPVIREDLADYLFEVERFDRLVGQALRKLEETGELNRTLVVMTSDHGMPFPRAKGNLYDAGSRVPLAMQWGERIPSKQRFTDVVSLVDLAPTILAACGIPSLEDCDGISFLEGIRFPDRNYQHRAFVLFGKERHTPCQEAPDLGGTPMRGIRTSRWLFIRNFRPDRWPAGTPNWQQAAWKQSWYGDCDNGPTKFFLIKYRNMPDVRPFYELAFAKRPAEELYDLNRDPEQIVNLAAKEEYRQVLAELRRKLEAELIKTGDPRVTGDGVEIFESTPYYGGGVMRVDLTDWPEPNHRNRDKKDDK
ncbi:MAG: heparan N-sulfatase [Planctomycetota bacterium]|nr:MAG: heparan N-sulfatase [Planctomycetota bacterium]